MKKVLNMTYASSLTNLCEINSSFDTGILRICYIGKNRNGSCFSKKSIERSIPTIYNCPIVCNYNRETDTLGGHDVDVVCDDEGTMRIVNITQPIGIIPESSRVWFDEYEEENGTVHEYLYAEVLLWKRQEAYLKIKKDGITAHSMEITVKDGNMTDGVYHINDFEFTAFALIGETPCFEGSALTTFSKQDFKQQLSEMMQELKESLKQVTTSHEVDNTYLQNYSTEGGKKALNEKIILAAKYGIDIKSLDFSVEELTIEELAEKFEAIKSASNGSVSPVESEASSDSTGDKFSLTSNIVDEIYRILGEEKVKCEWGESERYFYVDCDFEASEVYCWDSNDWLLYGFPYTINGDEITVDFNGKKRKKYVIADFDEGEQPSPFAPTFNLMGQELEKGSKLRAEYQAISNKAASMEAELSDLRKFKENAEAAAAENERGKIFDRFADLKGTEAFEALKADCAKYDLETIEEKCYAIRGRNGGTVKFALETKAPIIRVGKTDIPNEPYGGIFAEYGISANN